jgi:cytochrome c oxidase assembly protein subunit 15
VQLSPSRYRWICAAALGLLIAIVITGAAVRLTGSGLGCDDWPNCNDERLVDVSSSHAAIEQVNRLFTGLVSAAVIAAVLGSLWRRPRRRDLVWLSLGLVAGVLAQIVLGGILVIFDLHPILVQGHMILSLALVGTAVVLLQRAGEPDGVPRVPAVSATARRLIWTLATLTGAAIVAGTVVTAAGPHAGDEDVERLGVDISTAARVHGMLVVAALAAAVALALAASRRPADRSLVGPVSSWIFVGLLQAAIGYLQYFNDVPALLVGLHVAGATLLWAMTVHLILARRRPLVSPSEGGRTDRGGVVTSAAT